MRILLDQIKQELLTLTTTFNHKSHLDFNRKWDWNEQCIIFKQTLFMMYEYTVDL